MSWRIVLDYGTHRDYYPVRSSEFSANYIATRWREIAKHCGDNVKITVEKVR